MVGVTGGPPCSGPTAVCVDVLQAWEGGPDGPLSRVNHPPESPLVPLGGTQDTLYGAGVKVPKCPERKSEVPVSSNNKGAGSLS